MNRAFSAGIFGFANPAALPQAFNEGCAVGALLESPTTGFANICSRFAVRSVAASRWTKHNERRPQGDGYKFTRIQK